MRRLILSRPDRVGDVLITSSCLPALREKFPDTEIFLLAHARMAPLFRDHPLLNGFLPLADIAAGMHSLDADAIVHFHPDAIIYDAAQRAHIPQRIGYLDPGLRAYLTKGVTDHRSEGLRHEAHYCFDLLACLGVTMPAELHPSVHLPEAARQTLITRLPWPLTTTAYVALNPTAHADDLRWPWERFCEIALWLHHEKNLLPVLISADLDDDDLQKLHGTLRQRNCPVINLAGQLDLAELAWLLRHARLHIARNTGSSHLAAAVNCPQVELFGRHEGPYSDTRWHALSKRSVRIKSAVRRRFWETTRYFWRRGYASITVEEVRQAVARILID